MRSALVVVVLSAVLFAQCAAFIPPPPPPPIITATTTDYYSTTSTATADPSYTNYTDSATGSYDTNSTTPDTATGGSYDTNVTDATATATTDAPPTNDTSTAVGDPIPDPVVTCSAPGTVYYSPTTQQLISDFGSLSSSAADAAYTSLYSQGLAAAPAIWKIASDPLSPYKTFQGTGYTNELSSSPPSDISVTQAALLLFDAIVLQNPTPYDTVGFRPSFDSSLSDADLAAEALVFYGDWLNELSMAAYTHTTALAYSRAYPLRTPPTGFECSNFTRPAGATSLTPLVDWVGSVLPSTVAANATDPWTLRPGSSTPIDRTQPSTQGSQPWIKLYKPVTPRPYNCIAWALGHSDAWYWPDGVMSTDCNTSKPITNKNYTDMLAADGYDASKESPCDGPCPPGKGPKVMMIFKYYRSTGSPPRCRLDLNHGMRKDSDKWTSKNGQTGVYDGIADGDVNRFLDRFYPEPPTRVKKCYCKP